MNEPMLWGSLLQLSHNMWSDRDDPQAPEYWPVRDHLLFDDSLWNDLIQQMARSGMNLLVIDLGDGVQYASHPEIATGKAWSCD
jgi:hypothetical protein